MIFPCSCILDLPAYDTRLDLSVLKEAKVYYVVKNGTEDQFQVNLCGGIEASEKCPKGVGLCNQDQVLVKAGFKMETWFDYQSQQIKLEYTDQDEKKALFTFECDLNEDVKIEFNGQEDGQDKYKFLVKTKRVCLSQPQNCQFHDESSGNFYDLSGLQRQFTEWIADDDNDKDQKYHLSVCKPISLLICHHCIRFQILKLETMPLTFVEDYNQVLVDLEHPYATRTS